MARPHHFTSAHDTNTANSYQVRPEPLDASAQRVIDEAMGEQGQDDRRSRFAPAEE